MVEKKGIIDCYILAVALGLFGAHHFYLRRPWFGVLYLFTLGLFGVGYIVDLFRVPYLVEQANDRLQNPGRLQTKNLSDAYLLWFPCGLLGFHNFYLGRYGWGILYLFTLGLFGIGWIVDGLRMVWLVERMNSRLTNSPYEARVLEEAYLFTLFPLTGLLGVQHYYLGRITTGIYYTFTLGGLGIGWIMDWFRMKIVVERTNTRLRGPRIRSEAYVDDAYMYHFPLGFLGLHQFYLKRYEWGILYFFTVGIFGIGWLVDLFRLPMLVKEYNKKLPPRTTIPTVTGTIVHAVTDRPAQGITVAASGPNRPSDFGGHQYPGYPAYPVNPQGPSYSQAPPGGYPQAPPGGYPQAPPGGYPQSTPGGYPQGPDSMSSVPSSNVSDDPPSYAQSVERQYNSQQNKTASAPPLFQKGLRFLRQKF